MIVPLPRGPMFLAKAAMVCCAIQPVTPGAASSAHASLTLPGAYELHLVKAHDQRATPGPRLRGRHP